MFIKVLKESGIRNLLNSLQEIADVAAKEFTNEKALDSIDDEWDQKKIELNSYKIPRSAILTL